MSLFSTSSAFAKDTWLPAYANELEHSEGSLLAKLGMNYDRTTKIEGRRAYMKMQVGDDQGFGVITQGGDLPADGDIASAEATLSLMRFGETISLDGHEKGLLDSLDAAAAPIIAKKMSAAKNRTIRELERISIMDGTGWLAKHASDSGSTVTLDVSGNEYPERNPYTWIDRPGRSRYTLINGTTGADVVQGFTLTSKVESTNVLTCSTTMTAGTAGDYIVTDYGTSKWTTGGVISSPEFPGLLGVINATNTYLGINRSTAANEFWRAVVDDNSGTNRSFTETLARTIVSKLSRTAEDGMVSLTDHFALASPGVYNAYQTLMTSGIRYTGSETPDIGWGGRPYILMEGIKLYRHIHAPRNMVLIVHQPTTKYVTAKHSPTDSNFQFITGNGGDIWFPATASSGQGYADKWYAYITGFLGMYSERPANNAKLDDLTEVSGSY